MLTGVVAIAMVVESFTQNMSPTGPSRAGARAGRGGYPNASTLLRRSMAVMQRSLHRVYSEGTIRVTVGVNAPRSGTTRVTGDCVMRPPETTRS